jgi:histidine triad (HIT) family protein
MINKETNCIFCKIIKKEIPCDIVYEDNNFLVFLDINPVVLGHSLLIPKEHHVWMHESPDELISETFITTKKIMNIMRQGLNCDYVQIYVVGKDVPHLHVHLMPRFLNDHLQQFKTITYKDEIEKQEYIEKIKSAQN